MNKKQLYNELALAGFFLAVTCWYLLDTYKASARTENLLLILPAAVVVIALCLWNILLACYRYRRSVAAGTVPERVEKDVKKRVSVPLAMALLGAFVLSMNWIGFDLATFLFIFGMLLLQGERRWFWLGPFSLSFAIIVALFFEYMVPYPMPMLLGREFLERLL